MIATDSSNQTDYASEIEWRGHKLWLAAPFPPCDVHEVDVMHHYDDAGRHYCPTGFLCCPMCLGTADEPEPHECTLVGEKG